MKTKSVFTCQNCGYQSPKWLGRCPDCNSWNTFVEEDYASLSTTTTVSSFADASTQPLLLKDVEVKEEERLKTGMEEFDRVLGGGIVKGSVVLVGGDPGIGKSTISLQVCNHLAKLGKKVLYVTAEESLLQVKMRSLRLAKKEDASFYILSHTDLSFIMEQINRLKPEVVFIDSIQAIFWPQISSAAGSVSQIRECAGILTRIAKTGGISIFIIGHVTKEGTLAGPRVLEHIVDTVLYFEGDRFSVYRIMRAVKNRFGSTNEIGVFQMTDAGLKEVANPSEVFLAERPQEVSGSVITCILEGTRTLLVEVQALVSRAGFGYARRKAQGFDFNRLNFIIAILEKKIGLHLENEDVFVNIAGGLKIEDPAADLAVSVAVGSAFRDIPIAKDMVILGELDLASQVRSVSQIELRIREAQRLGFKNCILPRYNYRHIDKTKYKDINFIDVANLAEALDILLQQGGR